MSAEEARWAGLGPEDSEPSEQAAATIQRLNAENAHLRKLLASFVTNVGSQSICRGCGGSIYWIQHNTGKNAPYNPSGLSHFSTCPQAQNFRKEKK